MAEGMHGRGVCVAGGLCMAGGHVCRGVMRGIRSMSGRYASYWNAFLLVVQIEEISFHLLEYMAYISKGRPRAMNCCLSFQLTHWKNFFYVR